VTTKLLGYAENAKRSTRCFNTPAGNYLPGISEFRAYAEQWLFSITA